MAPSSNNPSLFNNTAEGSNQNQDKKQEKIIIVVAVIFSILVAGAMVTGLVFFYNHIVVRQSDYLAFNNELKSVRTKADKSFNDFLTIDSVAVKRSEGTDDTAANIVKVKKSLNEYKASHKKLASMKALQDKAVKEKYNVYITQYNTYIAYVEARMVAVEKGIVASDKCKEANLAGSTTAEEYSDAAALCRKAYQAIGDLADDEYDELVRYQLRSLDKFEAIIMQASNLAEVTDEMSTKLVSDANDVFADFKDSVDKLNIKMEKHAQDVMPRDELTQPEKDVRQKVNK